MKYACRTSAFRSVARLHRILAFVLLGLSVQGFANTIDLSRLAFVPTTINTDISLETMPVLLSRSISRNTLETRITQYESAIAETEAVSGIYDQKIYEDGMTLARLYQQTGQHEKALELFGKAFHVTRVNNGLHDLTQADVLKGMIKSYLALGNFTTAHEKQEFLLFINQRNFPADSLEIIPSRIEWADWNMQLYLRERSSDPVSFSLNNQDSFNQTRINQRLVEAQSQYYTVLEILTEQESLDDPRLVNTERKVAALNYMINEDITEMLARIPVSMGGSQSQSFNRNDPSSSMQFYNGIEALKRAVAYAYNAENPEFDLVAERIMELGDWYLLFDRRAAALQVYQEAFTVLSSSSLSQSEIERIMTPGMPLQLPEMVDRLSGKIPESPRYKGYIDVEFALNKFGRASKPAIINASEGSVEAIHKELLKTIRSCKFRPRIVHDDATGDTGEEIVKLRYYYTY